MTWKEEGVLNRNAADRLREILEREPTSKEIAQLRHGEQALKLEDSKLAKSGQLKSEAQRLCNVSKELLFEVRAKRKKSRGLLRAATKRRLDRKRP